MYDFAPFKSLRLLNSLQVDHILLVMHAKRQIETVEKQEEGMHQQSKLKI